MTLGKRFIPVIAPDDERGTEFTTAMYDVQAVADNVHRGYQGCHHVRTLVVDLDDLPHLAESPDERLQRVERCMLALTAEWLDLTGRAEPPLPVPEAVRMRAVIEAMRQQNERLAKLLEECRCRS